MDSFPLKLSEFPEVSPMRRKRIGFWMSAKKMKKMDMNRFAVVCRANGYDLVQVDFDRPLDEQGPFDIFFHKLTDMIVRTDQVAVQLFRDLENYMWKYPQTVIIDPVHNIQKLLFRKNQYYLTSTSDACLHERVFTPSFVELLDNEPDQMLRQMHQAEVRFPIVCKPREAHGSEAHRMMIVFNADGLGSIKVPCVAQSFVNHDATLYKVFVIGDKFHVIRKPSFQNFYTTNLPPIVFDSQNICGAQWLCEDADRLTQLPIIAAGSVPVDDTELDPDVLSCIVQGVRRQFGLSLIGIDLVYDISSRKLAIIDVNAFPSYDGVPNFFHSLFAFLHGSLSKRDVKPLTNASTNGRIVSGAKQNISGQNLPVLSSLFTLH